MRDATGAAAGHLSANDQPAIIAHDGMNIDCV